MSTLVIVLRLVPLLAFAGSLLLSETKDRGRAKTRARASGSYRAPLVANFAAFGLYVPSLVVSSASIGSALLLACSGAVLGAAGAVIVARSRSELGSAWSFVPTADQGTGLVTTGPYRLVR